MTVLAALAGHKQAWVTTYLCLLSALKFGVGLAD